MRRCCPSSVTLQLKGRGGGGCDGYLWGRVTAAGGGGWGWWRGAGVNTRVSVGSTVALTAPFSASPLVPVLHLQWSEVLKQLNFE